MVFLLVAACAVTSPEFKNRLGQDEQLVSIPTSRGVTVRILLKTPEAGSNGTFLYFPGSEGHLVNSQGRPRWGYTRVFPEFSFVVGVVDMPSDRPGGAWAGDRFRTSRAHLDDAKSIIEFVHRNWAKPIFLIGHSAGTTSVAHIAASLEDKRIAGVVFTGAPSLLAKLPLHEITYPTLFVHHREDTCASFDMALQQYQRLIKSSRPGFIEVRGGDPSRGAQCRRPDPAAAPADPARRKDYTHGFAGKEREVVASISDWAVGKPAPNRIEP